MTARAPFVPVSDPSNQAVSVSVYFGPDRGWGPSSPENPVPNGGNAMISAPRGTTSESGQVCVKVETPPDANGGTMQREGCIPARQEGDIDVRLDQLGPSPQPFLSTGGTITVSMSSMNGTGVKAIEQAWNEGEKGGKGETGRVAQEDGGMKADFSGQNHLQYCRFSGQPR